MWIYNAHDHSHSMWLRARTCFARRLSYFYATMRQQIQTEYKNSFRGMCRGISCTCKWRGRKRERLAGKVTQERGPNGFIGLSGGNFHVDASCAVIDAISHPSRVALSPQVSPRVIVVQVEHKAKPLLGKFFFESTPIWQKCLVCTCSDNYSCYPTY